MGNGDPSITTIPGWYCMDLLLCLHFSQCALVSIQGLSNDQVLRYVIDGGVMERPENCPEKLYSLMCRCWQHRPTARPTFMQIVSLLLDDAMPNFRNVSFYHSPEGQELLQLPQRKYFCDHLLRHNENNLEYNFFEY